MCGGGWYRSLTRAIVEESHGERRRGGMTDQSRQKTSATGSKQSQQQASVTRKEMESREGSHANRTKLGRFVGQCPPSRSAGSGRREKGPVQKLRFVSRPGHKLVP